MSKKFFYKKFFRLLLFSTLLLSNGCDAPSFNQPQNLPANRTSSPDFVIPSTSSQNNLYPSPADLISIESLLNYVADLTAVQPYSGWRNSASSGEAQALTETTQTLNQFDYLNEIGMQLEQQKFNVFMGTEIRESKLELTVNDKLSEVPADALRGHRDDTTLAIRFDSDGTFNDAQPDPITASGPLILIDSAEQITSLTAETVRGQIVFLDYAVIDRGQINLQQAVSIAHDLVMLNPAGIVMVTRYSSKQGVSHGSFIGDGSAFTWVDAPYNPPILYTRIEDLASLGIRTWKDLEKVESAQLTWDADIFSPASSGNLIATIPGVDSSRALILSAHIDSPNAPGAMDDGSGCAILLEIARVLNDNQIQPPTDLVLAWFGSEELGLYGSQFFANSHQELLDRTTAVLQIDDLTRPLDGIQAQNYLVTWSYGRFTDDPMPWSQSLAALGADLGIPVRLLNEFSGYSDNLSFSGYDVPNADLIYMNPEQMDAVGGVWVGGQIHNPYDTLDLAREMSVPFTEMAQLALAAVLQPPASDQDLRIPPNPTQRAVIVASHTEINHLTPSNMTDLGMTLAVSGFDVDLVPFGQPVAAADLAGAKLVFAFPVIDYENTAAGLIGGDRGWSEAEINVLEEYVNSGGLLVISNTAHRLKYGISPLDKNEDAVNMNALANRFGITFSAETINPSYAEPQADHPLMNEINTLELSPGNGVSFEMDNGTVLATALTQPAVALVPHGKGQVLVLADHALLTNDWGSQRNTTLWLNLAKFAKE